MAALPYMPLYVADYMADAAHLTTTQHGAYMLLIMTYWQRGEALPSDDRKLARIARMTPDEWAENREDLEEFFQVSETHWQHKRIEAELQKVREKSEKAASAAKRRHSGRTADAEQTHCGRTADAQRTQCHTDTDTDTDRLDAREGAADPPSAPSGRKKPRQTIPHDWQPSDTGRQYAVRHGLSIAQAEAEAEKFRDHWLAKGEARADWEASWRLWVRKSREPPPWVPDAAKLTPRQLLKQQCK